MVGRLSRWLPLVAAALVSYPLAASGGAFQHLGAHRDDVDVSAYPWSSIGKLTNETGASCSGVVIARDKILTAAHCLFNPRTRRFIGAQALHFLVGYRTGRYSAHARVVSYEIGAGFDPLRYDQTSSADWAVLTVTESLPASIEPLKLAHDFSPTGTKAVMAGYPQDRAHAMTADSDCELGDKIGGGQLYLNTCRGIGGYSGAPILVQAGNNDVRVAGIQIASIDSGGIKRMIAVPAPSIARRSDPTPNEPVWDPTAIPSDPPVVASCEAPAQVAHRLLVRPVPVMTWHDDALFDRRAERFARLAWVALP
jgi:protease YdgD